MTENGDILIPFNPKLAEGTISRTLFSDFINEIKKLQSNTEIKDWVDSIENMRQYWLDKAKEAFYNEDYSILIVSISVLCDLIAQGWKILIKKRQPYLHRPETNSNAFEEKDRIRRGLLVERENELRISSVSQFIKNMEHRKLTTKGWYSIFDLMRDGEKLSEELGTIARIQSEDKRITLLHNAIQPYIEFVRSGTICEHTGLPLSDIWRYFRYTWSSVYKPTPGRSILILIRDAAIKNHPVIGIAALANAVVQQSVRDEWIGWTPQAFIKFLDENPKTENIRWILDSLDNLISEIYIDDFLKKGIISAIHIQKPTEAIINKLHRESQKAREQHYLFPRVAEHKSKISTAKENLWLEQTQTSLFKSKRLEALALLLRARKDLSEIGLNTEDKKTLQRAIQDSKGRKAISIILRRVKATHVGINIMAITVCGSIPPYNAILGGKLVSLLMTSPEIVAECKRKYSNYQSIIASSIKGKAVIRNPNLILLETTSLYGVSSSQYNRIKVSTKELGGETDDVIEYIGFKKRTEGYGSFHFSRETVRLINQLVAQSNRGRRVNSIFGEGVNPRIRKIGDGLQLAGLPAEKLLMHGDSRIVYCIPLAKNFREILLGKSKKPQYLLLQNIPKNVTGAIVEYWIKRWLSNRILNDNVLEDIEKHDLAYPIKHGARVILPESIEENSIQTNLF